MVFHFMTIPQIIHSTADGHLSRFQVRDVMQITVDAVLRVSDARMYSLPLGVFPTEYRLHSVARSSLGDTAKNLAQSFSF